MGAQHLPSIYELCLALARADRGMRVQVSQQLSKQNLSMMEWLALNVVDEDPRNGMSMSQIAERLDVTLPQVTALINILVNMGLVKQKVVSTDKRGRQVLTTIKGRRTIQKLESQVAAAMREWNSNIPAKQLESYIDTVYKLADKA